VLIGQLDGRERHIEWRPSLPEMEPNRAWGARDAPTRQRRLERASCGRSQRAETALSREPQSLVLELLRNIRADVARVDDKVETLRADVAADFVEVRKEFVAVRKEMGEQIAGLRRAVVEYHSAVLGHGVLISELEARVRRIEQHLSLPEMDSN
jgi:hypothetical protein